MYMHSIMIFSKQEFIDRIEVIFFLNREKSMNLILIPYACKVKHIRNSVKSNDREF